MVDTWSARRMTDEGTIASNANQLSDLDIGVVIAKAKQGIGVS